MKVERLATRTLLRLQAMLQDLDGDEEWRKFKRCVDHTLQYRIGRQLRKEQNARERASQQDTSTS